MTRWANRLINSGAILIAWIVALAVIAWRSLHTPNTD